MAREFVLHSSGPVTPREAGNGIMLENHGITVIDMQISSSLRPQENFHKSNPFRTS